MTATMPDRQSDTSSAAAAPRPAARVRPPRPQRPVDGPWTVISTSATMLAIVCLWAVGQLMFLSSFEQTRDQSLLYDDFRTNLASATAPLGPTDDTGAPVESGTPIALLRIPRLGISQVVVQGTASGDTMAGPGHERNTVLPGQVGTSVVMGRATTYGGPFRDLGALRPGDDINVVMSQGEVEYKVINVRRAGDPYSQPLAAGSSRLVLATAEGSGALASLTPGSVVYVDADATKAFIPPAGLISSVPDSEQVMGTDSSALPLLVLYLALLVALTLVVVVARQRWNAVLVWVVTTPVALALAWATTDVAVRLLPNLV